MNYRPQVIDYLRAPVHEWLNVDSNNPAAVPNVYVYPDLQYLYRELCGHVAGELQAGAEQNAARCYAYNVFAENRFNNAAFAELMMFVAGKLAMDAWQLNRNPEQLAAGVVTECIQMAVGSVVDQHWGPEMDEMIPAALAHNVSAAAAEYDRIGALIEDFLGAAQGGGRSSGRGNFDTGRGDSMNSSFYNSRIRGGGSMSSGNMGRGMGSNFAGARSTASGRTQQPPTRRGEGRYGNPIGRNAAAAGAANTGRRWERKVRTNAEFEQQPEPQAEDVTRQPERLRNGWGRRGAADMDQTTSAPETQQQETPMQEEKLVWKPSDAQWYLQAFNPATHRQVLKRTDTGKVVQIIVEKDPEEMDYDRHAIPGYLGTVPKHQDVSKAAECTVRIMEASNALIGNPVLESDLAQQETPDYSVVVMDSNIVELSGDAAWFEGNLRRHAYLRDGVVPELFRTTAIVAEPIIGNQSFAAYVKVLSECKNYDELAVKISESYRACSPEFYAVVNNKMTALINRQLAQNLSLRARITSFADDWEEAREGVAKISERAALALLANEGRVIRAAFSELEEPHLAVLEARVKGMFNFPEGKEPSVTFVPSYRTLSYLNVESGQLEIELAKAMPTLLTEDNSPAMYNAVQSIIETTPAADRVECHYIRTNDCRIYEVTTGYMVQNSQMKAYLITLVK